MGPKMPDREGIKTMDVVTLELGGRLGERKISGPVWIQAGHPDHSVTVHLGYGRRKAGRAGTGAGFDAYALRTTNALWFATGGKLTKTGDHYQLASTQGYPTMDTCARATHPLGPDARPEE